MPASTFFRTDYSCADAPSPFRLKGTLQRGSLIDFCGIPCVVVLAQPGEFFISPLGVPGVFRVPWEMMAGKWTSRKLEEYANA